MEQEIDISDDDLPKIEIFCVRLIYFVNLF